MKSVIPFLMSVSLLSLLSLPLLAQERDAPWGRSAAQTINYTPQKVVYDVAVSTRAELESVIDRVSFLNNIYGADPFDASIVVVLHGPEITRFAIQNLAQERELMARARSLTQAGPIEFRMCIVAARAPSFAPEDIHGFVQMVPMADAEIIRLQREQGYAYMR